jgi:GT2 family glycosyltransferase
MMRPRVIAVVVTYNRRRLLLECLAGLCRQTRRPDAVVVVDNASEDGTAAAVRAAFPGARLHELTRNTGGAGGFAFGLATALHDGADLVWLMDDDTVPAPDALGALLAARARYRGPAPALVASRVVWSDGRPHPMNTPRPKPLASRAQRRAAADVGCVAIRTASFVSVLVDGAVTRARGLPIADYFIWNDDFEFTARLVRGNTGLLCPASVVVHNTRTFGSSDADPGERFYFEVRNKVWLLVRATSLTPPERVIYAVSTLRRWLLTLARSTDRRPLWRGLAQGLRDGLRAGPRPTGVVLAGLELPDVAAVRHRLRVV